VRVGLYYTEWRDVIHKLSLLLRLWLNVTGQERVAVVKSGDDEMMTQNHWSSRWLIAVVVKPEISSGGSNTVVIRPRSAGDRGSPRQETECMLHSTFVLSPIVVHIAYPCKAEVVGSFFKSGSLVYFYDCVSITVSFYYRTIKIKISLFYGSNIRTVKLA